MVPETPQWWLPYKMKIRHSVSDAYAANTKAEHGLQANMPGFVMNRVFCAVHKLATALGSTLDLCKNDISGVLNIGLGCAQVGSARTLRHCLACIFEESLEIVYSDPPPETVQHRTEVYNLFLPVQHASTRATSRRNQLRRLILSTFLNGDISSPKIIHHCGWGCCRDGLQTLHHFKTFVCWALIPMKPPVYNRKDWRQSDDAVDFTAVLASHHNLLARVLEKFTGRPSAPISEKMVISSAVRQGWSDSEPDQDEPDQPALLSSDAAAADEADGNADNVNADAGVADKTDWVKMNEKHRTDMVTWAQSRPYERLVLIREVLAIMLTLFAKFFMLAGADFARKQEAEAAQGKPRKFPVLEAARGHDVHAAFQSFSAALQNRPLALGNHVSADARSLRFRMLVRAMCALHRLLRMPREHMPFSLFLMLDGQHDQVQRTPDCMCDPLAKAIKEQYPTEADLQSTECMMIIEALATIYDLDISDIEAKHATTREYWKLRSRGWTPSLEAVSARFCLRFSDWFSGSHHDKRPTGPNARPRKAKIIRGGGAWRVFVHNKAAGKKFDPAFLRQLARDFRALSPEDRAWYDEAGAAAALAHRHHQKPFPRAMPPARLRKSSAESVPAPGTVADSGALIAIQANQSMSMNPYAGPSFTDKYLALKDKQRREPEIDPLALTKQELVVLDAWKQNVSGLPLASETKEELALPENFPTSSRACSGFTRRRSASDRLVCMQWQPPTAGNVQALKPVTVLCWNF